ncbi:hypothetical protein ASPWEDRAFT_437777 [Aspergillus wentii DTO 134E9]|uniref:Uncharacterized protein n=1 Tax=Aspergillus wentii DTO 134E9 TaxID=1073089 RepID=A0A1L9RQ00_ASPWE|nr:uncharacterized protein ASPWEDRAFT_437777 [Aspergillus wentii DTO 134E9]OJJ37040.1 hypothetical protein ASPWEDRAFT_437777 [Aspergillus wentii DTO 134E9]
MRFIIRKGLKCAYHPVYGVDGWHHLINLWFLAREKSVEDVFRYSRICHASDPKDRIYGVLGIFERQMIPIDYNTEATDIYRQFTESAIQKYSTIEIFHWFGPRKGPGGLCSWVPDYGLSGVAGTLPWPLRDGRRKCRRKPQFRFREEDLIIKGRHLGLVKEISCELVPDGQHIPGSEGFTRVLYEWESLAAKVKYNTCWKTTGCAFE